MNVFAIYLEVEIENKPDWFVKFREKYDRDCDLHITLKQPCIIGEGEVEKVKRMFIEFTKENDFVKNLEIEFEKINIEKESDGKYCVMIDSSKDDEVINFQKSVIDKFADFKKYEEPELENYEINFRPHITIGRNLIETQIDQVSEDLKNFQSIEGIVCKLVLLIVDERGKIVLKQEL